LDSVESLRPILDPDAEEAAFCPRPGAATAKGHAGTAIAYDTNNVFSIPARNVLDLIGDAKPDVSAHECGATKASR